MEIPTWVICFVSAVIEGCTHLVQERLYRSTKLWTFYVDLEESLGTLESTKACYDQIIDLRIATPQIILNYALFLQENKYWEDSFKV